MFPRLSSLVALTVYNPSSSSLYVTGKKFVGIVYLTVLLSSSPSFVVTTPFSIKSPLLSKTLICLLSF